jgi:phosphopantetheinyl transferase
MPTSAAKVEAPTDQKQIWRRAAIRHETPEIPASQHGRVRALTSYGMTREQVAEHYGVTVDEVERIIGREGRPPRHLPPAASR